MTLWQSIDPFEEIESCIPVYVGDGVTPSRAVELLTIGLTRVISLWLYLLNGVMYPLGIYSWAPAREPAPLGFVGTQ